MAEHSPWPAQPLVDEMQESIAVYGDRGQKEEGVLGGHIQGLLGFRVVLKLE